MLNEIKDFLKSIFRNRRISETPKLRCKCVWILPRICPHAYLSVQDSAYLTVEQCRILQARSDISCSHRAVLVSPHYIRASVVMKSISCIECQMSREISAKRWLIRVYRINLTWKTFLSTEQLKTVPKRQLMQLYYFVISHIQCSLNSLFIKIVDKIDFFIV